MNKNPALDGVRGAAFLLVLLAHISNRFGGPFQGLGKVGVWIFFVLSAFLLTRYFLERPERALVRDEWVRYAKRRFFRIIPLFWLTILIYLPFGYVIASPNAAINNALLLSGSGHLWTIVVEFKFYAVLPLVVYALIALSKLPTTLTVFIAVFAWSALVYFTHDRTDNISLLTFLAVFLTGSGAAFLIKRMHRPPSSLLIVSGWVAVLVIIITTPSLWSKIVAPVDPARFYHHHAMFSIVAAAIIIAAVKTEFWSRIFSCAPLTFCGLISYSGYLLHPIILLAVSRHVGGPDVVKAMLAAALSLCAGVVGYSLVERPLTTLADKRRTVRFV